MFIIKELWQCRNNTINVWCLWFQFMILKNVLFPLRTEWYWWGEQRRGMFHPLLYLPSACTVLGWAWPLPTVRRSHMDCWDSRNWDIICYLPGSCQGSAGGTPSRNSDMRCGCLPATAQLALPWCLSLWPLQVQFLMVAHVFTCYSCFQLYLHTNVELIVKNWYEA